MRAQSPAERTACREAPFMTAVEELADLVEPPDPTCPESEIAFLSHLPMVEVVTPPCGAKSETKSLSEDRIVFVLLI